MVLCGLHRDQYLQITLMIAINILGVTESASKWSCLSRNNGEANIKELKPTGFMYFMKIKT